MNSLYANGAPAPYPGPRPAPGQAPDTSRNLRLSVRKKRGFGGAIPQAGAGGSPLAERVWPATLTIAIATMLTAAVLLATCTPAHAAGSGMPWEAPLQRILESIEGPVAKVVAVVTIIITGLTLAFGDMGGGFRRLVQIVFGLSIAFAATSFFLSFFSFAGGAMID